MKKKKKDKKWYICKDALTDSQISLNLNRMDTANDIQHNYKTCQFQSFQTSDKGLHHCRSYGPTLTSFSLFPTY